MDRLGIVQSHLTSGALQQTAATTTNASKSITVLGSCFMDYVAYCDRLPAVGETLHSELFQKGFGGKGANQAVMAGRLGANVRMVSVVGADGDGSDYVENFKKNAVDTRFVKQIPNQSTGLAMIMVDKSAHNAIVICPNVTTQLTVPYVSSTLPGCLQGADILICQNEIPIDTTLYALKTAHAAGIYTVFNPAPAPQTPQDLAKVKAHLRYVSMFCPNETEASQICGFAIKDVESAMKGAKSMMAEGSCKAVIITLGSLGAVLMERGKEPVYEKATEVKAVDTTGAGDCFVGTLANFLAAGNDLQKAVRKANYCAGVSVTRKGTQLSYPFKKDLPGELFTK